MYTWITRHPQVVQSPISNDCLKVMLDDQTKPQLIPKLLLQVSVIELHNISVSDPHDGGLRDARDEDGKIIISDSTLRSLFPNQSKKCLHVTHIHMKSTHLYKIYWENIARPSDDFFFGRTKFTRSLWIAHFAVDILLLHHYKSNLAHLSDFDSLVNGLPKSEIRAKTNEKNEGLIVYLRNLYTFQ